MKTNAVDEAANLLDAMAGRLAHAADQIREIANAEAQEEIERELPTLYTFRDGLIVRIDGFTEKAEALEAAGLSE